MVMHPARTSSRLVLLALLVLTTAAAVLAAIAILSYRPGPRPPARPIVRAGNWSVSLLPTSAQAPSKPWVPGPDPNSPDPDGNGLDARGCPYPNPYPDIVSDADYAIARSDPDPRVLRCSVDHRTPLPGDHALFW
jgi:hypothetical protein